MALFETMRENTKVILWITVIAFVALIFLAWGANFTSGGRRGGGPQEGVLARVNGETISVPEFDQGLEMARATYEEQTGKQPDDNLYLMLQASTWEQLVDRALVRREAAKRGVTVTDREVSVAMLQSPLPRYRSNPGFQNEQGQFDIQRYQAWLADPQTNTLPLEREYQDLIRQEKLRMQVLAGVIVSENEVRQAWLEQNERADAGLVMVPYARITVPEEVDDATLDAFLKERAADFRLPDQVSIEYVKLPKQPTTADSIQAASEIEEAYNEFRRGEDFTVLVQSYSQAPVERWGGPTGPYLDRSQLGPGKLADAAFTLPVGEVSSILVEPDGFHVFRVEDRKTEEGVEKVRIADIFVPLKISYDTNQTLRGRMLDLADSTEAGGFRQAAEQLGLKVAETGPFNPEGFVPGLGRLEAAKEFARLARPLAISKPIETAEAWFVLHLSERRPAREATLEDVRPRLKAIYLLEQRKQAARAAAQALLVRCQSGVPLETAAETDARATYQKAEGVTRQGSVPGIGRDAAVAAAVFGTNQPGLIPRVIPGTTAAFVVQVLSRVTLDEAGFAEKREEVRGRLLRDRQNRVVSEWMQQLRDRAQIEDFRPVVASM
jgi:peptidyl-prolyl cis-trans isomerase D